ncbi:MAG: type II secretion system protein [Phycisphaerales bacterium]
MSRTDRRAFTLIEMLVVVAIIGVVAAIVVPSLGAARRSARSAVCAANLKSQGAALRSYLTDHDERLPQVWIDPGSPDPAPLAPSPSAIHIGQLYAGVAGDLPFYGMNTIGVERRPLNAYLGLKSPPTDASQVGLHADEKYSIPVVHCPADQGVENEIFEMKGMAELLADARDSAYELLGNSYILNDHVLDPIGAGGKGFVPEIPTLVPLFENGTRPRDGRMPDVASPGRTWVIGEQAIYNYDRGGDRKVQWHFPKEVRTNLLFVDLHVGSRLAVPKPDPDNDPMVREHLNTTDEYTFLPEPGWPVDPSQQQ